jgi:hypothetical protein
MSSKIAQSALSVLAFVLLPFAGSSQNIRLEMNKNGRIENLKSGLIDHPMNIGVMIRDKQSDVLKNEINSRIGYVESVLSKTTTTDESDLTSKITSLEKELQQAKTANCKNCGPFTISQVEDRIKKLNRELFIVRQKHQLIRDLFCYGDFPAIKDEVRKNAAFYPSYRSGNINFNYDSSQEAYVATLPLAVNNSSLNIIRLDTFTSFLTKWHNTYQSLLNKSYIESLNAKIDITYNYIESLSVNIDELDTNTSQENLERLYHELGQYDSVWCKDNFIYQWLKNWAWYSKGDFSLNYLPVSDKQNKLKKMLLPNSDLKNKNEFLQKVASLKECIKCSELSLDTLKRLQHIADSLSPIVSLNDSLLAEIQQNKKALDAFRSTRTTIHSITLPPCCGAKWHQFHDASNNFLLCQGQTPIIRDGTPVFITVFNDTVDLNKSVELKQAKKDFKDKGFFVQDVSASLNELSVAATLLAPNYPKINAYLKKSSNPYPLQWNESEGYHMTSIDPQVSQYFESKIKELSKDSAIKLIISEIQTKKWRLDLLANMISSYLNDPTPGKLDENNALKTNYYTYSLKGLEADAPFTNRYEFVQKEKSLTANAYSVGLQRRVTIGAGIFFNTQNARQVFVDSAGGTVKITNTNTPAKFVVGLKFFPWKSFMADDKLRPMYPLQRISIFTGFEVTKPLDNLYAGIGYDLFPGLHLSAGLHVYKQDIYKVVNNQVADQRTVYKTSGLYYGLTLDPIVLASMISVLFK